MKHTFKTVSTVLVALGMTVCSVTALATNASAANDTNKNAPDSVGYTVDTSHNFDHHSSTDSTSVEGVTREPYSMAERPYYDRVYYSEAVFKDDAYSSIYFRQDSSLPYRFFTVIKNVPASDDPYMFYIQYKENPNTDPYIEATIDWDSINYTKVMKGGKYYAFKVTQQSDVTIEWDCYDNYVNAYGSNCYMVNSNTSVTEDVTYPTETFTATQPTEIPIYTSAPQPATTVEVASSADANYTFIPKDFTVPADADYLHITTNNTIYGTEIRKDLDVEVPLIADMSSDIFSRPVDVKKYNAIYAGAQKNLAMAGVTIVIVKDDALGKAPREIPTMLDYRTHVSKGSMFNTPPVVPIYCALENLRWIKKQGGVEAMDKLAKQRAEIVYGEIDRNKMFVGTAQAQDRSLMNLCFVMAPEYKDLEKDFLDFAVSKGMVGVKGHRDVGGFRASCYNAQTIEGVNALVACMKEFEAQH